MLARCVVFAGPPKPARSRGSHENRDIAAFADVLRGGQDAEHGSLADIRELALAAAGDDADRREMVSLIDRAIGLRGRTAVR